MSNIIPFNFGQSEIRVVEVNGSIELVAKDVAEALGYAWQPNVVAHVPDEWKGSNPITTLGGTQKMITLTEQGVYFFLGRSDKAGALPFQKWIAGDVVPSIRKTGGYQAQSAEPIKATADAAKLFRPMFQIARLIGCDKNAAAISANQAVSAVSGTNLLGLLGQSHLEAENQDALFFTPTELGKQMGGLSGQKVNLLLAGAGLQAKVGEHWKPLDAGKDFARLYDTGKKHSDGVPVQQVKWSDTVLPLLKQEEVA